MPAAVPRRAEIPQEHTWNIESIFATEADWDAAVEEAKRRLPELEKFAGKLADGPGALADAMGAVESIMVLIGHVFAYASMLHDVDTEDQAAAAKDDRALALFAETVATISFLDPELLAIGIEKLGDWCQRDERVRKYAHYFDTLESRREHVRSAEVEEVLGLAGNAFGTARATHGILADADLTFRPAVSSNGDRIALSQGNVDALLTDSDREVRRTAWENYADAHLALKNTMANCLAGGVKQDVLLARVRGFSSSLQAALEPVHVPAEVFHNLIQTYRSHLPTWHKYWRLRRESFGYDSLHEYDIKAPMIVDPPKVSFKQSMEWIAEGMAPLGQEYVQTMARGVREQRWVDVYPNIGKRAGAYSGGSHGTHPFILMSYTDDIYSMSTLAHELGHSLHSYYTWRTQPPIYADYSTFVAEVASNFNQAMVRNYLFESNPDPRFQIALIDEAMSNFHRYFFIMPTLARFELEIHERTERDEPLTADGLTSLLGGLFKEGYGDEVEFDADRIGITWAEFPTHLYMNFYVFQYATGIS
ncbi:MAG TPA: M3 family oligoendopeptidase, partial [Chloroflexota bacterium]|nr:M3 family oligoendopeptidase [Chloroflexota bacterium]